MRTIYSILLLLCLTVSAKANSSEISENRFRADTVPQVTCPPNASLFLSANACTVPFDYTVTVDDNQPGWTLTQTGGYPSGTDFPVGKIINTFLAEDSEGNTATCSFSVTVWDTIVPVALCNTGVVVSLGANDPNDCYDGQVAWYPALLADAGSYDNCGGIKIFISRTVPLTDCINSLNAINGHPECDSDIDPFPDFPSEFERAISQSDSFKVYCCEQGYSSVVAPDFRLWVFQLDSAGNFSLRPNGTLVYGICYTEITVDTVTCIYNEHPLGGNLILDANNVVFSMIPCSKCPKSSSGPSETGPIRCTPPAAASLAVSLSEMWTPARTSSTCCRRRGCGMCATTPKP